MVSVTQDESDNTDPVHVSMPVRDFQSIASTDGQFNSKIEIGRE